MNVKRALLALGAASLIVVAGALGFQLLLTTPAPDTAQLAPTTPSIVQPETPAEDALVSVNGRAIGATALDLAYAGLLDRYRTSYAQTGGNLDDQFRGMEGAYYQLQIRYQALQQLINRTLVGLEVEKLGLKADPDAVEAAAQKQFDQFLSTNGLSKQDLAEVFADPQKRTLMRQILNVTDTSVEEMQARLHREAELELLSQQLLDAVLGQTSVTSEAGQKTLNDWINGLKAQSDIVYHDPLLNAFDLESQIEKQPDLPSRQAALDDAIAAYKQIKDAGSSEDPNLDFFLSRLYNLKVNYGLALEKELVEQAEQSQQNDQTLKDIQAQIALNRMLASQSVSAFDAATRDQLETLVQSDPGNPYYYYLYAKLLLEQWESVGVVQPLRILWGALSRDKDYVDAHVLMGDLNMLREFYKDAIDNYTTAQEIYPRIIDTDNAYKTQDNTLDRIEIKLSKALLARVPQIEQFPETSDDPEGEHATLLARARVLLDELLGRMNKTQDDFYLVLATRGEYDFVVKDYASAQRYLTQSVELVPTKETYSKLGLAYLADDKLDNAQQSFESALKLDKNYANAHLGLAKVYRARGEFDAANAAYLRAFNLGHDLTYTERRQIALEALELDSSNLEMRLALTDFYLERNVYSGAIKQYDAMLENDPGSVVALTGLGKVALGKLDYPEALLLFDKALAQNPTPEQQIELYDFIYNTSRNVAGPGNLVDAAGQEALFQLASLYLDTGQLSNSLRAIQLLKDRYAPFRTEGVSALEQRLVQVVGDSLPGSPVPTLGNPIVAPGEGHPAYNSLPPTSGWHYTIPADWGVHATQILDEIQLRNLAAGGVMLQYQPSLASTARQALAELFGQLRRLGQCRLILAPYEGLDQPIVLTAWNRILKLEEVDRDQIETFVNTFTGKGPEVIEVGCTR